jgi:hypothetical protein
MMKQPITSMLTRPSELAAEEEAEVEIPSFPVSAPSAKKTICGCSPDVPISYFSSIRSCSVKDVATQVRLINPMR